MTKYQIVQAASLTQLEVNVLAVIGGDPTLQPISGQLIDQRTQLYVQILGDRGGSTKYKIVTAANLAQLQIDVLVELTADNTLNAINNIFLDIRTQRYMQILTDAQGGGGGGGAGNTVVTVGTGGDFATVALATAAGNRNMLIISDVTEVSDVILATGETSVRTSGINEWNLDNFSVKFSQDFDFLEITGALQLTMASLGAKSALDNNGFIGTNLKLNDVGFNNISAVPDANLTNCELIFITGGFMQLSNFKSCFIDDTAGTVIIRGAVIVGGGTDCEAIIQGLNDVTLDQISLLGQFSTTPGILVIDSTGTFTNIESSLVGTSNFRIAGIISGWNNNATSINLTVTGGGIGENSKFSNIIGVGILDVLDKECSFSNIDMQSLDMSDTSASQCNFNGCTLTDAIDTVVEGSRNKFTGNDFADDLIFNGLNNIADSNLVGTVAGGGAETITINTPGNTCIVTSNITDSAVVDNSGGSSVVANNLVYAP